MSELVEYAAGATTRDTRGVTGSRAGIDTRCEMSTNGARPSPAIRVLLLEHSPVVIEGIAQWLRRHAEFEFSGHVGNPSDMGAALRKARPDVLVMEITLGGTDGIRLIKATVADHPDVRILAFSHHDERLYAERALRAGATGYVSKCAPEAEFVAALRTVAAGGLYASQRLSLLLLGRLLRPGARQADATGIGSLTDRELHVFQLLGSGIGVRELAARLGVSAKTVQAHRENIKNKLGFNTSTELLQDAARWLAAHAENGSRPAP